EHFLRGVLGPRHDELGVHFFEGRSTARENLLYASPGAAAKPLPFERAMALEFGGQVFTAAWSRSPAFVGSGESAAVWAATSSALVSLLMVGLVVSLHSVGRRASALAAERTAQLAATEERFRTAFESAGIGTAIVGIDGRWQRVNQRLCEITGY